MGAVSSPSTRYYASQRCPSRPRVVTNCRAAVRNSRSSRSGRLEALSWPPLRARAVLAVRLNQEYTEWAVSSLLSHAQAGRGPVMAGSSPSAFGSIVRKADVRVPAGRDFKRITDP